MIKDIRKKVDSLLQEKKDFYNKVDKVSDEHREELIKLLANMFVNIMSKIRRGTPNGSNLISLYMYKESNNGKAYNDLVDLSKVELLKGGMDIENLLNVTLESEENLTFKFRYSYINVDGIKIYLNKNETNIDLTILLHILEHIALHPFFKQENFKYLKKLNEFKKG